MKIDKIYRKGQCESTHIVPDKTLAKLFEVIEGNLYVILLRIVRIKLYCPLIGICLTCWKIQHYLNHLCF